MFVKKSVFHLFSVLIVLLSMLVFEGSPGVSARSDPQKSDQPSTKQLIDAGEYPTDQIIVKYKQTEEAFFAPTSADQMGRLSNAAGVTLEYFREMSGDAHVMRLKERLPLEQVRVLAQQLMKLPQVEYAEADQIFTHTLAPNDPQYANQWHYFGNWGINLPAAWDITTGSSSIVVAVIDTGITNHPDLNGRTVPGYDFISSVAVANDGNGRDNNPSDPGDWVAANECGFNSADNSSWHGTHVAGTIGASGNNSVGVAGINWNSKILPIRVLGKCGGYDSDIADGMRWAAGLSVAGVPSNPNPARVLNISLGGPGSCSASYQTAINAITSAGAVVVVAAGNNDVNASGFTPANCNNVITVAATNIAGSRAYYSNYGASVEISAPGGAQSFANDPNGVLSTSNTGTTSPVAGTYLYYQGTSMAAPHISGIVSLMLSRNPALTPSGVLQILQSTAKAFPGGGSCNTSICGSGIANAGAAVASALQTNPPGPFNKSAPANGATNQSTNLTLSWAASSQAIGYSYCYDTVQNNTCDTSWTAAGSTSAILSGLIPQTTYYWQVRASNNLGTTYANNSAWWSFGTGQGNNDMIAAPVVIGSLPYTNNQSTISATTAAGDPVFACTFAQGYKTVWYRYTPAVSQTLTVDTFGSNYDTVLAVWSGSPGSLVSVGCNDDIGGGFQSQVTVMVTAGVSYYIEVASFFSGGGALTLHATGVPFPTISGNAGASGVTLSYTDGVLKTATADASGFYSFPVTPGWDGTVTPSPACFTFTPLSKNYVNVTVNQTSQNYTAAFNGASGCSNISIDIGGINLGNYGVTPETSTRASFAENNGPVEATSPNGVPFLIAERDAWLLNGVVQSFSEMMGLPGNQVTDTYYFPWYNNLTMDTQLRFANLGNTSTNITVTIAGVPQPVIPLAAGVSTRVSYPINNGPVKVQSSGGVPIIVAERDAWLMNGVVQSFSEMMGLPANQLTDTYYFPWYNNVTMDTQLRFANLGAVPTNITVTIAGIAQTPITVAAGESTRVSYPINAGPVKVQSSGGTPIIVAERDAWLINGVVKSFSEMMGLPGNQLTTTYHFPWYNNITMDTQLRFANLGNASTDITVTIAGVAQTPITVLAGESTRISYPINNGPVTVTSSGGVPIIVAERDAWLLNGAVRSFSEMMGLPGNQLTTTYYFPWYNNLTMDTQLRFAVP